MTTLLELVTTTIHDPCHGLTRLLREPENHVELQPLESWQQALLATLVRHHSVTFDILAQHEKNQSVTSLAGLARVIHMVQAKEDNHVDLANLHGWRLNPFIKNSVETFLIPGLLDAWVDVLNRAPNSWYGRSWAGRLVEQAAKSRLHRLSTLANTLDEDYLYLLMAEITGATGTTPINMLKLMEVIDNASTTIGNAYPQDLFSAVAIAHLLSMRVREGASPSALLPVLATVYESSNRLDVPAADAALKEWVREPHVPLEWFIALHGDWFGEGS